MKRRAAARPDGEVRLARCDIAACEGHCCHDGAYLDRSDEKRMAAAIEAYPEFFRHVPEAFIVKENWNGLGAGRKTATRPWKYRRQMPAHFTATRCVFGEDNGWCSLESAARANGLHPWTFKPTICFLFPLVDGDPASGPCKPGHDPHDLGPSYPGFATIVECGKHKPDGRPWREVLKEELEILETPIDVYFADWRASRS